MAETLLEVRDLHVCYGQAHILQGVSLTVGSQIKALIGRNGMGKTTLCQAIMGLVPVHSGEVRIAGMPLVGLPPYQIASQGIGYVPQGRRIFPSLSVDEHLRMMNPKPGSRWTVDTVYELFPRLRERRTSGGAQLSGGEQQMLAIGRALLLNPRLLVMDEPSEGLAPNLVDTLVETLRKIAAEGIGILVVEQRLAVASALSERLSVMVKGQIAVEIEASKLLADAEAQRRYLGVS